MIDFMKAFLVGIIGGAIGVLTNCAIYFYSQFIFKVNIPNDTYSFSWGFWILSAMLFLAGFYLAAEEE